MVFYTSSIQQKTEETNFSGKQLTFRHYFTFVFLIDSLLPQSFQEPRMELADSCSSIKLISLLQLLP